MSVIDVEDLASYLRDNTAISPSGELVVDLANGIVAEVLGSTTPTARARAITFEVAGRAWRNPQGLANERIDDYSYGRPAGTREAGVYLTAEERAELEAIVGGTASTAAFTIRPGALQQCVQY